MEDAVGVVRVICGETGQKFVSLDENTGEVTVSDGSKTRTFQSDYAFSAETPLSVCTARLVSSLSLPSLLLRCGSIAFLSYGPRNTGKSHLFFSDTGGLFSSVLRELKWEKLRVAVSEIVYVEKAAAEVWVDLLNPENESSQRERKFVEVADEEQAKMVVEVAKRHASSWESTADSSQTCLRLSRGHTVLDLSLTISSSVFHIAFIDTAGFEPSKACASLRPLLPSDQQLIFTRMGLLQLRGYLRNLADGKNRDPSHRFKLVSAAESACLGAKVVFLVALREDSSLADAGNALELMETVKTIRSEEGTAKESEESAVTFEEFAVKFAMKRDGGSGEALHCVSPRLIGDVPAKQCNLVAKPALEAAENSDWLSNFDSRRSRILARSQKPPAKSSTSVESNRLITLESSQGSPKSASYELEEAEIVRMREECVAMEQEYEGNREELQAIGRHIAALEVELEGTKEDTQRKLAALRRENELATEKFSREMESQGGTQLMDFFSADFAQLESRLSAVNSQIATVESMSESLPQERQLIKSLKLLISDMNSEAQQRKEEITALQSARRKWDMAEQCYSNVCSHTESLEREMETLAERTARQESKAERLVDEFRKEKARHDRVSAAKSAAQATNSQLHLADMRQKHVISLRSSTETVSTTAGTGAIHRDIRLLQETLRRAGRTNEVDLVSQLLTQTQVLTEELRKGKIRTRNMSTKAKKLQGSGREPSRPAPKSQSSDGRRLKFSFS